MEKLNVTFHKGDSFATYQPGGIYFDASSHLIKFAKDSTDIEIYSGVQSASYDDGILTIVNESGESLIINLSESIFDLCEYPSDIEEIEDITEKLNAKVTYIKDVVFGNHCAYGYINSIRAKKVISKEAFLTNAFKFGTAPVETKTYTYSDYEHVVFKINLEGSSLHPDVRFHYDDTNLYLDYVIAWEDSSEWSIGDLVFYKKYACGFDQSNWAYKVPRYISKLFYDEDYDMPELKRYVKSQHRKLAKDLQMGNPSKCTLQTPYINVGDTSLICNRASYRMPIYVLASNGILYNRIGTQMTSQKGTDSCGHGSDAQGDGSGQFRDPFDGTYFSLQNFFLLEKQGNLSGPERYYSTNFFCPLDANSLGCIGNGPLPYVFIKTRNLRLPGDDSEVLRGDGGGLIAVHINNIANNEIVGINKLENSKYQFYIACPIDPYLGCVIKNTDRIPILNNSVGSNNNYIVMDSSHNLDMQAWICNRYFDEFVRVKKDYLIVNPVTCTRYNDPNEPHGPSIKTDFTFDYAFRKDDVAKLSMGRNYTGGEYAFNVNRFLEMLADKLAYSSYIKSVKCNRGHRFTWKRFMFNKSGNFRSNICILPNEYYNHDDFMAIRPYKSAEGDVKIPLQNQLNTWKIFSEQYSFKDIVAHYIINHVLGINIANENYIKTNFGALDSINNIKEKYVDFHIYKNYICKKNSENLKSKHEARGITVRLIFGSNKAWDFSELIERFNAYRDGTLSAVDFLKSTCRIKILGDIVSSKNVIQ